MTRLTRTLPALVPLAFLPLACALDRLDGVNDNTTHVPADATIDPGTTTSPALACSR